MEKTVFIKQYLFNDFCTEILHSPNKKCIKLGFSEIIKLFTSMKMILRLILPDLIFQCFKG